jgi:hypothetical protein
MNNEQSSDTRGRGKIRTALALAGLALFFFVAIIINKS